MSEPIKCAVCQKQNADFTDKFILVNSTSSSSSVHISADTQQVTTWTQESVRCVEDLGICKHCLRKVKISSIVGSVLTAGIFCAILSVCFDKGWFFPVLFVVVAGLGIASVISEILMDWPFILERKLREKHSETQYVPTDTKYYCKRGCQIPDKKIFIRKNDLRLKETAEKLFDALYHSQND